MKRLVTIAAITLAGCGGPDVSLKNASPEQATEALAKERVQGLSPGEWETKVELIEADIPGMPKGAGEMMAKQAAAQPPARYCITPEEAAKPGGNLFTGSGKGDCTVEKLTMSGGRIDQVVSCANPDGKPGMRMTTSGTYSAASVDGTAEMDMIGVMKMKVKLASRRVGECPAKKS